MGEKKDFFSPVSTSSSLRDASLSLRYRRRSNGRKNFIFFPRFFLFLMERITLILKTIEDKNPYRLLDPERQMSDRVT